VADDHAFSVRFLACVHGPDCMECVSDGGSAIIEGYVRLRQALLAWVQEHDIRRASSGLGLGQLVSHSEAVEDLLTIIERGAYG
jgi:hypothetical protein